MLPLPDLYQFTPEHSQSGFLVLELAALGLAGYHDTGLVDQANCRACLIDVLTACTGGAEDLHFIIFCLDFKIFAVILDLGDHFHCRERGLTTGVGIKGRNTN